MTKADNKPAFVKRDTIIAGKEYAQLLTTLKARFRRSQIKAAIKVNAFYAGILLVYGPGYFKAP